MSGSDGEIFVGVLRSAGDLGGVFEYDGDTGYFYRYDQTSPPGGQVLGAIHVVSGSPGFSESDIDIRWNRTETVVGLFINGRLWAAFDDENSYGGNYKPGNTPSVPKLIADSFEQA